MKTDHSYNDHKREEIQKHSTMHGHSMANAW